MLINKLIIYWGANPPGWARHISTSMYSRALKSCTCTLEIANCKIIKALPFAPPTIYTNATHVVSTLGTPLNNLVHQLTLASDIFAVMISAFDLIALMHTFGFFHLDARIVNIIVSDVYRTGAVPFKLASGDVKFCYAIDFESLYVPPHYTGVNVEAFNRDAIAMQQYGRMKYDKYSDATLHPYRFDVHALGESFIRAFGNWRLAHPVVEVCRSIINHTPDIIDGLTTEYKSYNYTEYLTNTSYPVLTATGASALLSKKNQEFVCSKANAHNVHNHSLTA